MNLREIQDLIKFVSKAGVSEVSLETENFKLIVKTDAASGKGKENPVYQIIQETPAITPLPVSPAPAPAAGLQVPASPVKTEEKTAVTTNQITIKSPMIGTFYRSAGPEKPPFINIGDEVMPGKVICIIEAMKLFNDIESDIKGRILKVLVDDASPVEYDQPLFLVETF